MQEGAFLREVGSAGQVVVAHATAAALAARPVSMRRRLGEEVPPSNYQKPGAWPTVPPAHVAGNRVLFAPAAAVASGPATSAGAFVVKNHLEEMPISYYPDPQVGTVAGAATPVNGGVGPAVDSNHAAGPDVVVGPAALGVPEADVSCSCTPIQTAVDAAAPPSVDGGARCPAVPRADDEYGAPQNQGQLRIGDRSEEEIM